MNYRSFFIPVLAGICLSACSYQHQLTPQELEEYARYVRNHDSAVAKLRNAAKQATVIEGKFYDVHTRKTTRVPMGKKEQDVVRRLFAGVESPPLLPQADWYEYQQYKRNMIHPSPHSASATSFFWLQMAECWPPKRFLNPLGQISETRKTPITTASSKAAMTRVNPPSTRTTYRSFSPSRNSYSSTTHSPS